MIKKAGGKRRQANGGDHRGRGSLSKTRRITRRSCFSSTFLQRRRSVVVMDTRPVVNNDSLVSNPLHAPTGTAPGDLQT